MTTDLLQIQKVGFSGDRRKRRKADQNPVVLSVVRNRCGDGVQLPSCSAEAFICRHAMCRGGERACAH